MKISILRTYFLTILLLAISSLVTACSVNIGPDANATPTDDGLQTFSTATLPPQPQQPGDSATSLPGESVPVTWASLNLTGKLVYNTARQEGNTPVLDIRVLDLATGKISIIFQAPAGAWIYFSTVTPDGKTLVMAYTQPSGNGANPHQELYSLALDGSKPPQLLFLPPSNDDEYMQPTFSPDGSFLYFSHVNYQAPPAQKGAHYPVFEVFRMAYPGGQPVKLADQAYWPRISADSARMAYVSLDPMTGKNKLFLANADGSGAAELTLGQGAPDVIDAPAFQADGQTLLYSAPIPTQAYVPPTPTWLERLFGISVASAHMVPSDWWSVPLSGGKTAQITHLQTTALYASVSPDKKHLASYSGQGLFVMNPDGTGLTMLVKDLGGGLGTVNWIP